MEDLKTLSHETKSQLFSALLCAEKTAEKNAAKCGQWSADAKKIGDTETANFWAGCKADYLATLEFSRVAKNNLY